MNTAKIKKLNYIYSGFQQYFGQLVRMKIKQTIIWTFSMITLRI